MKLDQDVVRGSTLTHVPAGLLVPAVGVHVVRGPRGLLRMLRMHGAAPVAMPAHGVVSDGRYRYAWLAPSRLAGLCSQL